MIRVLNLVFPPICIHCEERVENGRHLFCAGCTGFFELIDPSCRCVYCFVEHGTDYPCPECVRKRRWGVKIASALDYLGPVSSLVKQMKYGRMPYLAKTASAFMLAQFCRLGWPAPDLIIPVPRRHWFQGMNHAGLLAHHLAQGLQTTCLPLIKRRAGDLSQARLSKGQRESLPAASFYLKRGCALDEKVILLVDDVVTTGTTLRRCAETVSEGFPAQIYALSLARTTS